MDVDEDSIACADPGKRPHGVYLLFRRKQLVYVGRSNNPKHRIEVHRRNGRPFDYALHVGCEAEDAGWVEQALIKALQPRQNRQGNNNPDADPEPPIVIERVVVREEPKAVGFMDYEALSVSRAELYIVRRYGLGRVFRAAVKSGEVRSAPLNPDFPNGKRMVRTAEVVAWCEQR